MERPADKKTELDETLFADLFTPGDEESIQNFKTFSKLFHESWIAGTLKLKESIGKSDFSCIKQIGHTLKGTAANMGARAMIEISAAIEKRAASGEIEEIVRLSALLKSECEKVEISLEDYGRRLERRA